MTKGENHETGTVHQARTERGHLIQVCGIQVNQRVSLTATDAPITCKRCLARKPAATRRAEKPSAAASSGPVTWGVYGADGTLRTWDTTKRGALAKADRIGDEGLTVQKVS